MIYRERLKLFIPLLILITLFGIFYYELFYSEHEKLPQKMHRKLPAFHLVNVLNPEQSFTEKNLQGKVSLLNVWATWCESCAYEVPFLQKITDEYHIPLYGIQYKDSVKDAKAWFTQYGNPYILNGIDSTGETMIDLGISGTPETFVINASGYIIYHHLGVIDQQTWDTVLWPVIRQAG